MSAIESTSREWSSWTAALFRGHGVEPIQVSATKDFAGYIAKRTGQVALCAISWVADAVRGALYLAGSKHVDGAPFWTAKKVSVLSAEPPVSLSEAEKAAIAKACVVEAIESVTALCSVRDMTIDGWIYNTCVQGAANEINKFALQYSAEQTLALLSDLAKARTNGQIDGVKDIFSELKKSNVGQFLAKKSLKNILDATDPAKAAIQSLEAIALLKTHGLFSNEEEAALLAEYREKIQDRLIFHMQQLIQKKEIDRAYALYFIIKSIGLDMKSVNLLLKEQLGVDIKEEDAGLPKSEPKGNQGFSIRPIIAAARRGGLWLWWR